MSDFFSVVQLDYQERVGSDSNGDLWPSAWADDGWLYTANGDGTGFGSWPVADLAVSRLTGDPATGLSGERLASGRDVAPVWTDPERFNSKPTGMVAVDGNRDGRDELYLAVQDLRMGDHPDVFAEAPAAGIVRSTDGGRTWASAGSPHFTDHRFTTVMFLDFGQSNRHAETLGHQANDFVYAFGLDYNWRASTSGCVPDPTDLYLARVPADQIMDREAWRFYSGGRDSGTVEWTANIDHKVPVLTDHRRHYRPTLLAAGAAANADSPSRLGATYLAQGGVTYLPAFGRYLYTSFSEVSWIIYEAPAPWGPWREALTQDFGFDRWDGPGSTLAKQGGYAPTIPSRFLSEDCREAWVQSNWFWDAPTYGGDTYHFSLRRLRLERAPEEPGPGFGELVPPHQPRAEANLALRQAHPIGTTFRSGHPEVLNDGRIDRAEDSSTGSAKDFDYWGYTWALPLRMNRLVYTTGPVDLTSGFFAAQPWVEFRRAGEWARAPGVACSPPYPDWFESTGHKVYTFTFDPVTTTGIRLAGRPHGFRLRYTAIAELEVYWDTGASTARDGV
jgi:hypothetical protein